MAGPEPPGRVVQEPISPACIEQVLHVVRRFFPRGQPPLGLRDVSEPALADDVPPALDHAVGRAAPRVAEHRVVPVIDPEPVREIGGDLEPRRFRRKAFCFHEFWKNRTSETNCTKVGAGSRR